MTYPHEPGTPVGMGKSNYASYFDHTILKPDATRDEILQLCSEAREHGFFSVCVNPTWVPLCRERLSESSVKVCTVVGFPLGANLSSTKTTEVRQAIAAGADEVDVVINVGALKSGDRSLVERELLEMVAAAQPKTLVKVIVESGLLTADELTIAVAAVNNSGAEYIKTSTGFAAVGATPEAVRLMKALGRPGLKIKASGGIRTAQDFQTYADLGVHRIGASRSVDILRALEAL